MIHVSHLLLVLVRQKEFDRIVCVGDGFHDFHVGFEPVQPLEECPAIAQKWKYETSNKDIVIKLNNFGIVPDECRLHRLLSSDTEVLIIRGNTYPRWPAVPENFFFTYYRAKKELIDMLPYDPVNPPKTVVHLRAVSYSLLFVLKILANIRHLTRTV